MTNSIKTSNDTVKAISFDINEKKSYLANPVETINVQTAAYSFDKEQETPNNISPSYSFCNDFILDYVDHINDVPSVESDKFLEGAEYTNSPEHLNFNIISASDDLCFIETEDQTTEHVQTPECANYIIPGLELFCLTDHGSFIIGALTQMKNSNSTFIKLNPLETDIFKINGNTYFLKKVHNKEKGAKTHNFNFFSQTGNFRCKECKTFEKKGQGTVPYT